MNRTLSLLAGILLSGVSHAAEVDAKKLSSQLPSLFWYTLELWGNVDRGTSSGLTKEEFTGSMKTKFVKLASLKEPQETWQFHLYYGEFEENESWTFVLNYDGKKWTADSGVRKTGGSTFQLLESDPSTPSMRPQFQRSLELFNTGKLAEAVAKQSKQNAEAGTGQPATLPEPKSEGSDKPQPESEGRSR